ICAAQFFARMLEDAPAEQLPRLKAVDGSRSQVRLAIEGFTNVSASLVELSRRLGVPVQSVLLAAHFKVLTTMSGQERAVSCVTHNGRPETEGGARSLGLYLNSLPLSLELDGGTWRELIGRVAELRTDAMQYRGYPLSRIRQEVGLPFDEVSFNYTHFHAYRELTASGGLGPTVLGSTGYEQTNFDLLVDVARGVDNDSMYMVLIFDSQVYGEELMSRLGEYYVRAF